MAIKGIPELEKQGNSIVFTGEALDIYVPTSNFDSKLSEFNGEYISTMGIFLFEIRTEDQVNNNKHTMIHSMKMPATIDFQYTSNYKYTGELGNYPADEYQVFRLEAGNKFIASTVIEQNSAYAVKYIKSLHKGALPKMLTYDEILKLYHKSLELGNVNLKAPSIIYELTIAEACRSKSNIKKPFRYQVTKNLDVSRYDYKSTNINRLAMLNSTFGGLTFENINDAVLTAIERTENGDAEQETPLEKIARY